jgi:hypothetical protein
MPSGMCAKNGQPLHDWVHQRINSAVSACEQSTMYNHMCLTQRKQATILVCTLVLNEHLVHKSNVYCNTAQQLSEPAQTLAAMQLQ